MRLARGHVSSLALWIGLLPGLVFGYVETVELERPGGIRLEISIFEPSLHIHEGVVTPGQRIPDWVEAFAALLFPNYFDTYGEWRDYFGNGKWEREYLLGPGEFAEVRKVPVLWGFYKQENLRIPFTVKFERAGGGGEFLMIPYWFNGNARFPESYGKGEGVASSFLFRHEGEWRQIVNWRSPRIATMQSVRTGWELVERLEAGEFDELFDFTIHYQSFPEYDPEASAVGEAELSEEVKPVLPDAATERHEADDGATDEGPPDEQPKRFGWLAWLWWVLALAFVVGVGSIWRARR
jgi:hypothetical protein